MPTELEEWNVTEASFPAKGTPAERLAFLVRCAILAPSEHNSQPWVFHIAGETLELIADRKRALPVVDPDHRELIISCGAALYHLELAARRFGYRADVSILPDLKRHPDLLARLSLHLSSPATDEEHALFAAIPRRHTNRLAFQPKPVPADLLASLGEAAHAHGAWLVPIDNDHRVRAAELVMEADRLQGSDARFRRELAAWIHPNHTAAHDGVPGYGFGFSTVASYLGPFVVRNFDWGDEQARHDDELAEAAPALMVLGTEKDEPRAWLNAGKALAHVLLAATNREVSASFLNQPIELAELRPRLSSLLGRPGLPQLMFRLGYGPAVQATPRRGLEEVLRR
jgi:hypothetical protein